MTANALHFPIRYEATYALLSTALLILPSQSSIDVVDDVVHVRMGWAFRAAFPRAAVRSARDAGDVALTRGVHGFAGRWLVNGAGSRLVTLELDPEQRARVLGIPIGLRELTVSVEDPAAFRAAFA